MKRIYSFLIILSVLISGIPAFSEENAGMPNHVIINQVYGGGDLRNFGTPVSHSFAELYNPTEETVSLDGWSLQYASEGSSWSILKLSGEIKPKHSFLIRGGQHSSSARFKVTEYDMSWDICFNNKGIKVLLKSNTEPEKSVNPFNSKTDGYVDMVGAAGNRYYYLIDGCEADYAQIQSKQKSIRRNKFQDTDNNAKDFRAIDYRTSDLEEIRPRSTKDGSWTYNEFKRTKDIKAVSLEYEEGEFTFLHISDTQASTKGQFEEWGRLAQLLEGKEYAFSIHTGDFTDNPDSRDEMDMFYENSGSLMEKPFIPVAGNHDQKRSTFAELFSEYFGSMPGTEAPLPVTPGTTSSFDYGDAHFVILNSESDLSVQAQWLDEELRKTNKKWKIAAIHRSPYGAAGVNDTVIFAPVFDKYNVDLVIHGHDHLYLRSYPLSGGKPAEGGTVYLESGSSGIKQEEALIRQSYQEISLSPKAPTYSAITVGNDKISVTAQAIKDNKLETIDSFEIKKSGTGYIAPESPVFEAPVRSFSDVRTDKPFYNAVMLLSQLGLFEKSASFSPNASIKEGEFNSWLNFASASGLDISSEKEIKLGEAMTRTAKLLGYGDYINTGRAELEYVLRDIGLYNNIETDFGSTLNRGDAAQLILNALEAYLIKPVNIYENYVEYSQVYSTWLEEIHGVYKMRGIITDRPYYTRSSSDNSVSFINEYGEEIIAGYTEEIYDLLGYEIDAYIKDPYGGGRMLYGVKTKNNSVLTVKKRWYDSIGNTDKYIKFSYINDEGKTYIVDIDKKAEFVYNGAKSDELRERAINREKNAFKPSHIGKITLVDYNKDNIYDFVFVDNYKDIVVNDVDKTNYRITNKLEYIDGISEKKSKYTEISSITLDNTDPSYRLTFKTADSEEPSTFSSITEDCVVSVALSSLDGDDPETALVRRVYISNLSMCGIVSSIYEEDEDDYYVIGNKSYKLSKSFYNTYNGGESIDYPGISVGDYVSFYLDYDERIAYMGGDNLNSADRYGLLLGVYEDESDDETVNIRIVDESGKISLCCIDKKMYGRVFGESVSYPKLVKYRTAGDRITYAKQDFEPEITGSMQYQKASGRMGDYFIDSSTVIFAYSGEKNDGNAQNASLYHVVETDFLKNNTVYNADIFEPENYCNPSVIIVYYGANDISEEDNIMLVTDRRTVYTAENEPAETIWGQVNGKEISMELEECVKEYPQKGSVIQYAVSADGRIGKWRQICSQASEDFEQNTVFDNIFMAKYNDIVQQRGGIITVRYNGAVKNHITGPKTEVYKIDGEGGRMKVYKGSVYDITSGNSMFITVKEGFADEIFIWKTE